VASIAYFNKLGIIGSSSPGSSAAPTLFSTTQQESRGSTVQTLDGIADLLKKHIKVGNLDEFNKEAQKAVVQKVNLNIPISGGIHSFIFWL